MKAIFQCGEEDALYKIEDATIIPSKGEDVLIKDEWYSVTQRDFFLNYDQQDSVIVWVEKIKE